MFSFILEFGKIYLIISSLLIVFTTCSNATVRSKNFNSFVRQEQVGLYNSSDKVVVLSAINFNIFVHNKNRSILVEFYNSYCGHCKRFAPKYKDLAIQLYSWRDILSIGAIDCAVEENNDICREYEIMAYPTLRYFGPENFSNNKSYGIPIETQNIGAIRSKLALFLINEASFTDTIANFKVLTDWESDHLFNDHNTEIKLVIIMYEPVNSTIVLETALKYHRWPSFQIQRVANISIASKFSIDGNKNNISSVDRSGKITLYKGKQNVQDYFKAIEEIIESNNFKEKIEYIGVSNIINEDIDKDSINFYREIIIKVKQNEHLVYQADLEMAIRITLFNEIPKMSNIIGEKLLALQQFLLIVKNYNPLDENGKIFLSELYEYVVQHNEILTGKEFESEVIRLSKKFSSLFQASHFVGCISLRPALRGFTCSLWQLFHYLTVQAAQNEDSSNALQILQAIHGYVKYFFGCTECSNHFQSMAIKMQIWNVTIKNDAIIWLWTAHNTVNARLSGDLTEDPEFPKIQFPSLKSCPKCIDTKIETNNSTNINWNKIEVLNFLKNIYNPENISQFGMSKNFLTVNYETSRRKRNIVNVFSEVDIRMGMLLYALCIVIIVVAFKLFTFKKYRKKPYGYDFLGKV